MSGGARRIPFSPAETMRRLTEEGYSGYEFVWWVVHEKDGPGKFRYLGYPNMFCSKEGLQEFFTRRPAVSERVPIMVRLDQRTVQDETMHQSLMDVLLNQYVELSPVYRVEAALGRALLPDFDLSPCLNMWGECAGELLMGVPEYLDFCPVLRKSLSEGKEGLRGRLFPRL